VESAAMASAHCRVHNILKSLSMHNIGHNTRTQVTATAGQQGYFQLVVVMVCHLEVLTL
jgi:hypothetical protein